MDKGQKRLTKLVFNDIYSINQSVPKETVTLKVALDGKREIMLKDNTKHLMDADELKDFSEKLPSWMRWIVRVPITLAYNPSTELLKVLGSEWEERAVRYALGLDSLEKLNFLALEKLIMRYSSLIFILFDVRVEDIIGGDGYEGVL